MGGGIDPGDHRFRTRFVGVVLIRRCMEAFLIRRWDISALPNNGSMGEFGARAELRNILQENSEVYRGTSSCRFDRRFDKKKKKWAMQHRCTANETKMTSPYST